MPFQGNQIPTTSFDKIATNLLPIFQLQITVPGATSNNFFLLLPKDPKVPIYDYRGDWTINAANQLAFTGHYSPTVTEFTGPAPLSPDCYLSQGCGTYSGMKLSIKVWKNGLSIRIWLMRFTLLVYSRALWDKQTLR